MIFAVVDYFQFVRRKGPYGEQQTSVMGLAFEGMPPRDIVSLLKPGDVFVTQRLNTWFAWFMMYFSSSPIDHCGVYVGDGRIIHQTFTVSGVDPLRFVARGARILLLRPLDPRPLMEIERAPPSKWLRFIHRFKPKLQLAWVAAAISLGFYPDRFRWRVLGDVAILTAIIDLLTLSIAPFPLAIAFAAPLFAVGLVNQGRWLVWRLRKRPLPKLPSHPDLVLRAFNRSGGIMFTRLGPMVCGPFGVLPLHVVETIARDRPNSNESSEVAEIQEAFRAMLEDLQIEEAAKPKTSQSPPRA